MHDTVALVLLVFQKTRESPTLSQPSNEEMHYDVISFGFAKKKEKAAVDKRVE